jgi:protein O-mannosyl-transferase
LATPVKVQIPAQKSDLSLFSSREKRTTILCLLLVVVTLSVFNRASQNSFINFDDDGYVTENPHVRAGLTWETVRWAFTTNAQSNWHPFTWLSHIVDYQLFHFNPAGHHYTSVVLHVIDGVLLFLLLQGATGFTLRSLMVAAFFTFHPVNVESVAWVSERKNVLSMMFFLLAMMAYGRYLRKPAAKTYLAVGTLFAAGLMAKPQIITLPFVLLLWDYWPLRRMGSDSADTSSNSLPTRSLYFLVWEKLPFLGLSLISAVITLKVQAAGGAVRSQLEYPLWVRIENAVFSYAGYIGKALWPSHLSPMYPHPGQSLGWWPVLAALLLLIAISSLAYASRQRFLLMGWLWFLGTMVPMIGLVQVGSQGMADRYAHLPFIGLFIMICWGPAEWARRIGISWRWLAVPSTIALAALAGLSYRQIGYWHDSVTLWSHALQVTNENFVAHDNLGNALVYQGRFEEAIPHFRAAIAINPKDPLGHVNIGAYERQHDHLLEAIDHYQSALSLTSDKRLQATAYGNLGSAYRHMRDYPRAKASFEAALRLDNKNSVALIGMGLLSYRSGDFSQAADHFSRATASQPIDVSYLLLAGALEQSGRSADAQSAYQEAKHLSGDLAAAQQAADRLLAP